MDLESQDITSAGADGSESAEGAAAGGDDSTQALVRLQESLDALQDKYVRTLAEMDNMRRRHERERQDTIKFALESPLRDILPTMDAWGKACAPAAEEPEVVRAYREGFALLHNQFQAALRKHGVESFDSKGQPFDPNLHQAIQRIESQDVEIETVAEEFVCGYLLNGRLVRPAMVSVFVPSSAR